MAFDIKTWGDIAAAPGFALLGAGLCMGIGAIGPGIGEGSALIIS